MFIIKVQVIRNTVHRPSTQASYTIGSGTTMHENQPAAQIVAEHNKDYTRVAVVWSNALELARHAWKSKF